MPSKLCFVAACLVLAGCADDKDSDYEKLQGNWVSHWDTGLACSTVLTFEDDLLEIKQVCDLKGGGSGLEVDVTRFDVSGATLRWTTERSSCAGTDLAPNARDSAGFSFIGDRLRIATSEGLIIFERLEPSGSGTGSLQLGCFDSDGSFERHPISSI